MHATIRISSWRRWAVAGLIVWGTASAAPAQFEMLAPDSQFELSPVVQVDRIDSAAEAQLKRADAYLADRQWDDAVETLRSLMAAAPEKLALVTPPGIPQRYVPLRDLVHLRLATMPAEALALYRGRVDPTARQWYEEGVRNRDRTRLREVVDQAFASSYGDDALMALGEMALESGDDAAARWCWYRLVPAEAPPGQPNTWPGYPDTDLDLAAVHARLVLTSILEGSTARAREELAEFTRRYGDAEGRFGGRQTNYAAALGELLAESAAWPPRPVDPDWPTFGGSPRRQKRVPEPVEVGKVAWRAALPGGGPEAPLSWYPVVVGDLVLVNGQREIRAVRLESGKPAWRPDDASVYRDEIGVDPNPPRELAHALGVPHYTMTVCDGKLYARMGVPITAVPQDATPVIRPGYLVCLDLAAEGRLQWKVVPEEGWAIDGSPVADRGRVYVVMRRSDIRPQVHVACFDARSGRRLWRQFVCGADTPAAGRAYRCTHTLLTLVGQTLYFNTNLGAVAALSTRDGRIQWLSLYDRATGGDLRELAPHWQRDVNPCVYHRGMLLVAPSDSPGIFAFDAASGQMLWRSRDEVGDVTELLGTTDRHLIASGQRLVWIDLDGPQAGRVRHAWPDTPQGLGYGRGLLAGGRVYWPTREKALVFDARTAQPVRTIDLAPRGAGGGNLLAVGGRLLIATGSELIALDRYGGVPEEGPDALTYARVPDSARSNH